MTKCVNKKIRVTEADLILVEYLGEIVHDFYGDRYDLIKRFIDKRSRSRREVITFCIKKRGSC